MTTLELSAPIGKTVMVRMQEFSVPCVILDTKESWGRVRFQVTPLDGEGVAWIEDGRILSVVTDREEKADRAFSGGLRIAK